MSGAAATVAAAPAFIAVLVARVDARAGIDCADDKRLFRVEARVGTGDGRAIAIGKICIAAFHLVAAAARAAEFSRGISDGSDVKARIKIGPL